MTSLKCVGLLERFCGGAATVHFATLRTVFGWVERALAKLRGREVNESMDWAAHILGCTWIDN